MGTLTRSQLVSEISKNLGGRSNDTRTIIHLNMAQDRINRRRVWPELNIFESVSVVPTGTPANDRYYDLTNGGTVEISHLYGLARIVLGERPQPLIAIPTQQWIAFISKASEHDLGDPTHYNMWKPGSAEFYPVPNQTFTLLKFYRIKPVKFTSGSDVASSLEDKDDIIIAYATSSLFTSLGMLEDGGRYFTTAEALMKDAITYSMAQPSMTIVPRGVSVENSGVPRYYADPFVKRAP